ncbi:MAG: hypothetical protein EBU93_04750 [Chlamydiae bacterium]|nr:hypothetical protein [Chlamydiota bacterium]
MKKNASVDTVILEQIQKKMFQCQVFAINLKYHPAEKLVDATIDLDNLTYNILPNVFRILSNLENEDGNCILGVIGACELYLKLAVNFLERSKFSFIIVFLIAFRV